MFSKEMYLPLAMELLAVDTWEIEGADREDFFKRSVSPFRCLLSACHPAGLQKWVLEKATLIDADRFL